MKNKYTKKHNRNRENSNRKVQETEVIEDNLLERILSEEGAFGTTNEDFDIDIIGMSSDDEVSSDSIDDLDDDIDEDMASRLSLYESIVDDEEDEIREFVTRDVVAESRKRVNQPGRRKFEDSEKPRRDRAKHEKQSKKKREKTAEAKDNSNNKSVLDNLKDVYGKYTMHILYSTLGMLAVILIIAIIVVPKDKASDGKVTDRTSIDSKQTGESDGETSANLSGDSTEEGSTENKVTMADIKPEGEDTEIHKLIAGFIDAERVQCDVEKAKSYLEVAEGYSLEKYEMLNRYIETYEDIKCYKFDYLNDGMYYIYVTYKNKISNIDTLAVAGTAYVVRYNEEQGKYLIVTSYTKEEDAYRVIVENSPVVKVIKDDVEKRHNEALAKDKVLKEFIEIMQGASNPEEESSTEKK